MPCDPIHDDSGKITGIICSRGSRQPRCKWCGARSTKLCDFPVTRIVVHPSDMSAAALESGALSEAKIQTCDRPMCDRCAVSVGVNKDYCPPHARHAEKLAL